MIYSLTVTNSIGESLTFELSNPWASGYAIKTIDGLGTPDMNVNSTPYGIGDGSVLGSVKAEYRLITIILYPLAAPTVETTRQKLYRFFQIKKNILLTFNTENRLVNISGYVQKIEPNIFENPESISIEVKCLDPYFHKMAVDKTKFYGIQPMFEFPFSVEFEFLDDFTWVRDGYLNTIPWNDATYGNGVFVGVGRDSLSPMAYSHTGLYWNKVEFITNSEESWSTIEYGNGKFVALLKNSNIGAISYDGSSWELISLPIEAGWTCLTYGKDRFVAVAENSDKSIYSFNGTDWFEVDLGEKLTIDKVIYGNDIFVGIQRGTNLVLYTAYGDHWSTIELSNNFKLYDVTYGQEKYIFTTYGSECMIGNSLSNLSRFSINIIKYPFAVSYVDNMFLLINGSESCFSYDGKEWEKKSLPFGTEWCCALYGSDRTLLLGTNGYATVRVQDYEIVTPVEFSMFTIDNRMTIDYRGEIDAGIQIMIECKSPPGDIVIYNVDTLERMEIIADRIEVISGAPLGPKDIIEINTQSGSKYVRLLRNGIYYNLLGAMKRNMTWFTLQQGENTFTYTTSDEHSAISMTFSYQDTYAAI